MKIDTANYVWAIVQNCFILACVTVGIICTGTLWWLLLFLFMRITDNKKEKDEAQNEKADG